MRSVVALLAAGMLALPQEPTIRVDVELVNVLFSVRDKKGALIPNLTEDDFTIFEDGKQQEVRSFTRESDLPLTIGLLVDVSVSQENLIEIEKRAAYQFFSKVLRPKDMAFLISFGAEAELLQDLTNSPRLLENGLDGLRVSAQVGGLHPGPVPTATRPRGTILYDAVYLAANEKLRTEVGRKAMVIISDGADQGSRTSRDEAIAAALRADAIIYSIFYVDDNFARGYYSGDEGTLKRLSEDTGGRSFRVNRKTTLDDIFRMIQEEMRSQYAISYSPANSEKDGGFRKIEIKSKNKDLRVQARKGYFANRTLASDNR
jgi:VWFA-related protein